MHNLASAYRAAGKLDLALPLFEETLKLRKAKLGPDHPDTAGTMVSLGHLLIEKRLFTEAEPLLRESWPSAKKRSPTTGGPSTPGACSDQLSWARRNMPTPNRCS